MNYTHWRRSGVKTTSATSGIQGVFFSGCPIYILTFGAGQNIKPCHGRVALVRIAPLIIHNGTWLKEFASWWTILYYSYYQVLHIKYRVSSLRAILLHVSKCSSTYQRCTHRCWLLGQLLLRYVVPPSRSTDEQKNMSSHFCGRCAVCSRSSVSAHASKWLFFCCCDIIAKQQKRKLNKCRSSATLGL